MDALALFKEIFKLNCSPFVDCEGRESMVKTVSAGVEVGVTGGVASWAKREIGVRSIKKNNIGLTRIV